MIHEGKENERKKHKKAMEGVTSESIRDLIKALSVDPELREVLSVIINKIEAITE